jgi:hypothetical protein
MGLISRRSSDSRTHEAEMSFSFRFNTVWLLVGRLVELCWLIQMSIPRWFKDSVRYLLFFMTEECNVGLGWCYDLVLARSYPIYCDSS